MSETLCKINKKGDIETATLLWTNPDPDSAMASTSGSNGKRIILNQSIVKFDFIRIYWRTVGPLSDQNSSEFYSLENFADWPITKDTPSSGGVTWGQTASSNSRYKCNISLTNSSYITGSGFHPFYIRIGELSSSTQSYIGTDSSVVVTTWDGILFFDNYFIQSGKSPQKANDINVPLLIYGIKKKQPKAKDTPWLEPLEEDESDATLD